ncbi:unnamed protein product [Natator depressus]
MPTNTSLGINRLTIEFYRTIWDILSLDLAIIWSRSRVHPLSHGWAMLALLLKKGNFCDLKNWCPVSLLSTDHKIVAKATPLQLWFVLADMIHPNQTYTVPGWTIFDNLCRDQV